MIDNRSVGCNWLSIMKLQPIPNPMIYLVEYDIKNCGVAIFAGVFRQRHLVGVLKQVHHNIAPEKQQQKDTHNLL